MITFRWIVGVFFFAVGALIVVYNGPVRWIAFAARSRPSSPIPLVGGILAGLALVISPVEYARIWWWLPLLLDLGGIPGVVLGLVLKAIDREPD